MNYLLISENFYPVKNSGAVQLLDLSKELQSQGHQLLVLTPSDNIKSSWFMDLVDGVQVLRLRAFKLKDIGFARRALAELLMPFLMFWSYRKSPAGGMQWGAAIWYSPSIFHGFFIWLIKRKHNCKSYLIVRDIFPEWALDMGLIKRGFLYYFFKLVANFQYSIANIIGIQSKGNLKYFAKQVEKGNQRVEVLSNWLAPGKENVSCPIRMDNTSLSGRVIFVYAGNMGVAQGLEIFIELALRLQSHNDIGFLFVGRGTEAISLKNMSVKYNLDNTLFLDEINPSEIPDLYLQCHAGIIALDPRHKSHNIPGKFLTYMQSGLPVLANINPGTDLTKIILNERIGQVCESNNLDELFDLTLKLCAQLREDNQLKLRCQKLFQREYTVKKAASQIVKALS